MTLAYEGRVLALAPNSRGVGFVLFQDEITPLDWGVKEVRHDKNAECLRKAKTLMCRFRPDVIVLEHGSAPGSRRSKRVRKLLTLIAISARRQGIEVCRYSRLRVRKRFSVFGVGSKDDMAAGVAAMLPALAPRLPRRRKPWESEHYGMAIFEAAALGITHFAEQRR